MKKLFLILCLVLVFASVALSENYEMTIPLRPFKLYIEPSTDARADTHVLWFYDKAKPETEYVVINSDLLNDAETGNLYYIFNQEIITLYPGHTYVFSSQAFESSTGNSSLRSNELTLHILIETMPTATVLPEAYQRLSTSRIVQ